MPGTPPAERAVDAALVRALLTDQHPDLAHLPLSPAESGWDNAIFRLGEQMAVRLPRREAAAGLVVHEQVWLPRLAPDLPLPVPVPLREGLPGRGYPWRWSVLPWLPGGPADLRPPAEDQAVILGSFLHALHREAPADAPHNPVRGVPLASRAAVCAERSARRSGWLNDNHHRIWERALTAPVDEPPTWLHGDLHPGNVLVEDGRLSGIIDWGDLCAGDRATDLAAIWMLFESPAAPREALARCGPLSPATLDRARGWALHLGLTLLDTGLVDNPRHAAVGEATLRRLSTEETDP